MANSNNSIEYIETTSGLIKVYYPTLDQVPVSDTTLSEPGKFADAAAVGQRLGKLEESLKDENTGQVTTGNVIKRVTSIENKISDVNGQGKQISNIQNILANNGITNDTNNTKDITNMKSDIDVLQKAVGKSAMNLTNWNTATASGWYYNSDSTKVSNAPATKSGCVTYGETVSEKRQIAYIVSSDYFAKYERYYVGSGWKSWIDVTPMTAAITKTEFSNLINNL